MDAYTTTIQSKMSKIQASLLELNSEILMGMRFLLRLKEDAAEIVKNLNSITTPAAYLQEFTSVNSFILKYLSFLTEINCKFEILNISEKKFTGAFSGSKAISSAEMSEGFLSLNSCKCKEELKDKTVKGRVIIDEPLSESDTNFTPSDKTTGEPSQGKSSKKKIKGKRRNYWKGVKVLGNRNKSKTRSRSLITIKADHNNDDDDEDDDNNNNKNKNNPSDVENKNECTLQLSDTEEDNLVLESECIDISVVKDHCDQSQVSKAATEKETNCINENPVTKEILEEKSLADVSSSPSNDITKESPAVEIKGNRHLSLECIPVAETVPLKTQTSSSEVLEDRVDTEHTTDLKAIQTSKLEDDKDEEDCIKPEELIRTVGKEYNVVIEYIKSPSEFYVSVVDKQPNLLPELEKLLKLIPLNKTKVSSKNCKNKKALLSKQIGCYALLYSKCDEIWCRVKVMNWCLNLNDNFVTVFLLDYGETKCVSVDDLRQMPDCFKKYPISIHRCHLQGITPVDRDEKADALNWDKATSEKMKALTENSEALRIKIAPGDRFHPPASLPVTLWLVDENECVNQLLVKSEYAKWSSDQPAVNGEETGDGLVAKNEKEDEKLKDWNPMKEDFESYLNSYDLDMNDPAATIYGYVGSDYKRICKHFAGTGFCYKGIACKKEHKKLDPLGFTTDEEEVYKNAFNVLPSPQPNSVLNVQVTCLLKFNQFFCISERNKKTSSEEDLQSLLNCMNAVENVRDMKKLLIPPSTGQIVVARYSEDGCWYRARILESQPEKDAYTVVFMDYGNKEIMPLSHIRAIEPRYLHLPFQAMQCFIFGVGENPKVSFTDVMDYMNKKISDGHITIEVIACLPGDYLNLLVNVFDQNGRNIGKELIEMEYAVNKEEMVISAESESVPG